MSPTDDHAAGPAVELVVAGRPHRLPLDRALGVSPSASITRLPGAPPGVAGLVAVRGRLVVVFDPAALLGIGSAGDGSIVLLALAGPDTVGLLVDDLHVDELVGADGAPVEDDPQIADLLAQIDDHVLRGRPLRPVVHRAADGPVLDLDELLPIGLRP